jgi:hypothetical protein
VPTWTVVPRQRYAAIRGGQLRRARGEKIGCPPPRVHTPPRVFAGLDRTFGYRVLALSARSDELGSRGQFRGLVAGLVIGLSDFKGHLHTKFSYVFVTILSAACSFSGPELQWGSRVDLVEQRPGTQARQSQTRVHFFFQVVSFDSDLTWNFLLTIAGFN